jgi:uncharacterized damage-inducible protein DinB
MLSPSDLADLIAFNRWATERVLDATGGLAAEQLQRELGGSFPTLLGTLSHLAGAEQVWLGRWKGEPKAGPPAGWPPMDHAAVAAAWRAAGEGMAAFVGALTAEDVTRPLPFVTRAGDACTLPLGEVIQHVVNHATYHRGQVTNMLRLLDVPAPATDYMVYCLQKGRR